METKMAVTMMNQVSTCLIPTVVLQYTLITLLCWPRSTVAVFMLPPHQTAHPPHPHPNPEPRPAANQAAAPELCDLHLWYLDRVSEGALDGDLPPGKEHIKRRIETLIQRSRGNPAASRIACSTLRTFENILELPLHAAKASEGQETADKDRATAGRTVDENGHGQSGGSGILGDRNSESDLKAKEGRSAKQENLNTRNTHPQAPAKTDSVRKGLRKKDDGKDESVESFETDTDVDLLVVADEELTKKDSQDTTESEEGKILIDKNVRSDPSQKDKDDVKADKSGLSETDYSRFAVVGLVEESDGTGVRMRHNPDDSNSDDSFLGDSKSSNEKGQGKDGENNDKIDEENGNENIFDPHQLSERGYDDVVHGDDDEESSRKVGENDGPGFLSNIFNKDKADDDDTDIGDDSDQVKNDVVLYHTVNVKALPTKDSMNLMHSASCFAALLFPMCLKHTNQCCVFERLFLINLSEIDSFSSSKPMRKDLNFQRDCVMCYLSNGERDYTSNICRYFNIILGLEKKEAMNMGLRAPATTSQKIGGTCPSYHSRCFHEKDTLQCFPDHRELGHNATRHETAQPSTQNPSTIHKTSSGQNQKLPENDELSLTEVHSAEDAGIIDDNLDHPIGREGMNEVWSDPEVTSGAIEDDVNMGNGRWAMGHIQLPELRDLLDEDDDDDDLEKSESENMPQIGNDGGLIYDSNDDFIGRSTKEENDNPSVDTVESQLIMDHKKVQQLHSFIVSGSSPSETELRLQLSAAKQESRVQSLELLVLRLEKELLRHRLKEQNDSLHLVQLHNQILHVENEMLRLNQSYWQLQQENQALQHRHTNVLALADKGRQDSCLQNTSVGDNELIVAQQNKLVVLSELLHNQSMALKHLQTRSEQLEEQNKMLHQMVLNQTLLIASMMEKLQHLTEDNAKTRQEMREVKSVENMTRESQQIFYKLHEVLNQAASAQHSRTSTAFGIADQMSSSRFQHIVEFVKAAPSMMPLISDINMWTCHGNTSLRLCFLFVIILSPCAPYSTISWTRCPLLSGRLESKVAVAAFEALMLPSALDTLGQSPDPQNAKPTLKLPSVTEALFFDSQIQQENEGQSRTPKLKIVNKALHTDKSLDSVQIPAIKHPDTVNKANEGNSDSTNGDAKAGSKSETKLLNLALDAGKSEAQDSHGINADKPHDKFLPEAEKAVDLSVVSQHTEVPLSGRPEAKSGDGRTKEKSPSKVLPDAKDVLDIGVVNQKDGSQQKHSPGKAPSSDAAGKMLPKAAQDADKISKPNDAQEANRKTKEETVNEKEGDVTKKQTKKAEKSKEDEEKVRKLKRMEEAATRLLPYWSADNRKPKDCYDIYSKAGSGQSRNGAYKIFVKGLNLYVSVYCDMKGGGWTILLKREDGSVDFYRDWKDYTDGFGTPFSEHYLGNEVLHYLTNQDRYTLQVDLKDWVGGNRTAHYSHFWVDQEDSKFRLHVLDYSGTAGDGLGKHDGMAFSTRDSDNDLLPPQAMGGSCAKRFRGAGWYYKCYSSNLFGVHYVDGLVPDKQFDGVAWKPWTGPSYSLKEVVVKIRPTTAE